MKIHAGDSVLIITGKDKGKQGTVIRVLEEKNRRVVEGMNMRVRHIKKTPQQAGQRVSYEASLHASNVMILDPKTKKPTRIGYRIDEKTGQKKRIAKVSDMVIEKVAVTRSTGSGQASPEKGPKTQTPFWKRRPGGAKADESGKNQEGGTSFTAAHRAQGG